MRGLAAIVVWLVWAGCGDPARPPVYLDGWLALRDLAVPGVAVDGRGRDQGSAGAEAGRDAMGAFVKIVSPPDKAKLRNPVTFDIAAAKVAKVRLLADGWALADAWDPATKSSLTYNFVGTNYARLIRLEGQDSKERVVAWHEIQITVTSSPR